MSAYTWFTDLEYKTMEHVFSNKTLEQALQETRAIDDHFYIKEYEKKIKKWFKTKTVIYYALYYRTPGSAEARVINVDGKSVFGWTSVDRIITYLYGFISGFQKKNFVE